MSYSLKFIDNANVWHNISQTELEQILLVNNNNKINYIYKIDNSVLIPLVLYSEPRLGDEYINTSAFNRFNEFEKKIIVKYNDIRN